MCIRDRYQPLLSYLLNGIYIADEGSDVNHIFDTIDNKKDIFIISNSGHLLKSDKQISGGAVGLFEGKRLGRLKNFEMLVNELIKHNKLFSMMSYPMRDHGINQRANTTLHLRRTMVQFWKKNL